MKKNKLNIEEFILPLPDNHKEISDAADNLLAEMLIRYYIEKKKVDKMENYGKL